MVSTTYLVSTVVTGLVLVGVGAYLARAFAWRELASGAAVTTTGRADGAAALSGEGRTSARLPLALGGVGVVVVFASIGALVAGEAAVLGAVVGFFGGLLALYVTWGVYHICRARGMSYAQAVGAGVWLLSMVLLIGIVAQLLVNG
ncbi:hypothetical protein [Halobaculum limi]|uniref:hypothetical protein n=1 Tax=Halobaculum limi TaxID=3031916 RepID=UPI0024073A43|nr:hypothetical protein [Halobaculum sp. YSMS11]